MFARVYSVQKDWTHISFSPLKWSWNRVSGMYERQDEPVGFETRLQHYVRTAEVMITLASASLVFIPRLHIGIHPTLFAYSLVLLGLCVC